MDAETERVIRIQHAGTWRRQGPEDVPVEIERPGPVLLASDPAMERGCRALAQRVLLQAFDDAAHGHQGAAQWLTTPEGDGLLDHWIRQAHLPLPLEDFCRAAQECLDDPDRMSRLFGGPKQCRLQAASTMLGEVPDA